MKEKIYKFIEENQDRINKVLDITITLLIGWCIVAGMILYRSGA